MTSVNSLGFWSSVDLTGNQTLEQGPVVRRGFGAVLI